jgi:Xaa-Pro aminopeptidase
MVTDRDFHTSARQRFIERLAEPSVCIIFSGTSKKVTIDDEYRFFADVNFRYLTGLDREGMIYVVRKTEEMTLEMIFAPDKDEKEERWHGKRMSSDEIREITGIEKVMASEDYGAWLVDILADEDIKILTDLTSVTDETKELVKNSAERISDVSKILEEMRLIKASCEISCIREAARITEEAVESLKAYVKEGMTEYDLLTRLEYELARRSGQIFSFATIVACNSNSLYLHHSMADRDMKVVPGGYIQIDCGARCDGYCADISRVIFTGGKAPYEDPSDKRYLLHGIIKELRQEAMAFIRPGVTFAELNSVMHKICSERLKELGLIGEDEDPKEAVKRYYWHNTSHFLGLNVHDVGGKDKVFAAGMTLALEPGVYIPEWSMGFRIEDDVLVTENGCCYLSSGRDDAGEEYICI